MTSTPTAVSGSSCAGSAASDDLSNEDVEMIRPDEIVPDFQVATTDCRTLRSSDLLGHRPLVVVFFSSWCGVCDKKMPVVRRAAEELGEEATFLGVALDEDETWPAVPLFIQQHGLEFEVVRGSRHRAFALGYNPFQSVPVVVIVGKNGKLVDLQIGYSPFDYNRLLGAVEIAKRAAPPFDERVIPRGQPE